MKNLFKSTKPFGSLVLLAVFVFGMFQSNGQLIKPSSSGYAPVNGINVYYETYGSGMPIVLIHGAFMTIDGNWSQLIPELSKTRKIITIELQGHGHTAYSDRKLSVYTLASDVAGVLNYLKIDSADVAGYSMGGSVAYALAIQSPKRVTKLVIISSTYKTGGWLPEVSNAFKTMTPEIFANSPMKAAYDSVAPDKTKWTKFIAQMLVYAATPFNLGDANLSKIRAPVLIIAGDNDGLDKIELMKTYKMLGGDVFADMGAMPKSQLAIIPSQGHVSLMMQTTPILTYLNGFLK